MVLIRGYYFAIIFLVALFIALPGFARAEGEPVVFVGDFENKTGDVSYDSVGSGLGIHLSATLASTGKVRVVTHESRRAALTEARLAASGLTAAGETKAACELTGADVALSGSFALVAGEFIVGIEIVNASSGEMRALPPIYCGKSELKSMFERAGQGVLELLLGSSNKGLREDYEVVSDKVTIDVLLLKGEIDAKLFGADGRMRKNLDFVEKNGLIEKCEKILEYEPDDVYAHSCLGALYGSSLGIGDSEKAVLHYEKAIELAPGDAAAYSNLGVELAQSGRLEEAIEKYETAISLNVRYAPAHYNLALAHISLSDFESAEIELQNAIQFDRGYFSAYYFLGKTKRFLGKPAEAAEAYEKFFSCAPESESEKYSGLKRLVEQLKLEAELAVEPVISEE